jgi:thiopeptide-type bacteriocin biosynthesis protein
VDSLPVAPGALVDAVRAALAGGDLSTVAAAHGLTVDGLQAAVAAYHEAGTAALTSPAHRPWYTSRLALADRRRAEATMATIVGPALDRLCVGSTPVAWWFLRREGDWRVYLRHPDPAALGVFLHELGRGRSIAATQPLVHDPDVRPFGGLTGTTLVYDLWVAESRGILAHTRRADPPLGHREVSIAALDVLLASAGLDPAGRGDLYRHLTAGTPPHQAVDPAAREPATGPRTLVSDPAAHAAVSKPWADACATAGTQLAAAATHGLLTRPLATVLTRLVRAQWSRLGLSPTDQTALAHAAHQLYADQPLSPATCGPRPVTRKP